MRKGLRVLDGRVRGSQLGPVAAVNHGGIGRRRLLAGCGTVSGAVRSNLPSAIGSAIFSGVGCAVSGSSSDQLGGVLGDQLGGVLGDRLGDRIGFAAVLRQRARVELRAARRGGGSGRGAGGCLAQRADAPRRPRLQGVQSGPASGALATGSKLRLLRLLGAAGRFEKAIRAPPLHDTCVHLLWHPCGCAAEVRFRVDHEMYRLCSG